MKHMTEIEIHNHNLRAELIQSILTVVFIVSILISLGFMGYVLVWFETKGILAVMPQCIVALIMTIITMVIAYILEESNKPMLVKIRRNK